MENSENTIVAISTALGNGGISIIRISGSRAVEFADKVFSCKEKSVKDFTPRMLYLGTFEYNDIKDKCMCVYFKSPYSFTGEDVVEFQCHGGLTLTNAIYSSLVEVGCTPATKGEFSKRAFLNGKISLDEAEGIIDIINAESESEIKVGYQLMQGELKNKITTIQDNLTELLAKIEVTLDYPEEDLEEETSSAILNTLKTNQDEISTLLNTASLGKTIKDGSKILIYGKSNAGKSSLLNSLLSYNRAIVTDIKGTTRDTLEEVFIYKGYKFVLIDSAGIRNSDDIVENIGIQKSKDMVKEADIVLFVVDSSEKLTDEDFDIISTLNDKNTIVVYNKCDLARQIEADKIPFSKSIEISTKENTNIDKLKELILSNVIGNASNNNSLVITNQRHISSLKNAIDCLNSAIDGLNNFIQLDLISIDIKNAWIHLGDITGNSDNERIIDDIFSKFCVGK